MKQLEDKIRESLPRLKELTEGAIIYKPHWNVFSQKFEEDVFDEIEYRYGRFFEDGEPLMHFKLDVSYYIGHPIKLNDVLEYFALSNYVDGINMMTEFERDRGIQVIVRNWNLSSIYLADQSNELKQFLNAL